MNPPVLPTTGPPREAHKLAYFGLCRLWAKAAIVATTLLLQACTSIPATTPSVEPKSTPGIIQSSTTVQAIPGNKNANKASPSPAEQSVWPMLRHEFSLPLPKRRYLTSYVDSYTENPWAIETLLKRSTPYLAWISKEVSKTGLPAEIALLPLVESGFDPFASSPGGAVGLWQFIPATGRRFGLHQNGWYDGRRDIVKSTKAAIRYLQYLHKRFNGDWLLALAAYNTGEGKIRAAIRHNRSIGKPANFWHLELPRETKDYVPRLLALRLLIERPRHYGITLPGISAQAAFIEAKVHGQMDLSIAAQLADISIEQLIQLNPAHTRLATPPGGPHSIMLPENNVAIFLERLALLPAEQRIKSRTHKIKPGDTLGHIALRYNTNVTTLRSVNNLKGNRIKTGKELIIPIALHNFTSVRLAKNTRSSASTRKVFHGVRQGDTLWDLARLYGVSVRQLVSWNSISPGAYLRLGQQLVIWVSQA